MTDVLVLESSAIVEILITERPAPGLRERVVDGGELGSPHLVDLEFLQALRRLVRRSEITLDRAIDARTLLAELALLRFPHAPLTDRIWELRENMSAYDAAFVALAEALDSPLITCDAALAATPGHEARIELFSPA